MLSHLKFNSYLKTNRLQDIIAALQIMGSCDNYKMSIEKWNDIIDNKPLSDQSWEAVFKEHPEFFRENGKGLYSLMWRKGMPYKDKGDSREPLVAAQITALMETALQFHAKALEERRDRRWWVPIFAAITAFIGAVLGAYLKSST